MSKSHQDLYNIDKNKGKMSFKIYTYNIDKNKGKMSFKIYTYWNKGRFFCQPNIFPAFINVTLPKNKNGYFKICSLKGSLGNPKWFLYGIASKTFIFKSAGLLVSNNMLM